MQYNVLLDTNVFLACKYDFQNGQLSSLKKYEEKGAVHFVINDIITREVKHHIDTDVSLIAAQAKNSIRKHGELKCALSSDEYDMIESILLGVPSKLHDRFNEYIKNATSLPNNDLSLAEIFNDYFAPNAPFENIKDKKNEFPDAAVIMSIKRFVDSHNGFILHVVTDDKGWHDALKDLDSVVLHKNLGSVLTLISKEEDLFSKVVGFIKGKTSQIEKSIEGWLLDKDWAFAVDELEMCIECDVVDDVEVKETKVTPIGIDYIDAEEHYSIVSLRAESIMEIQFSYIDHSEEFYDREEHTWYNTKYGNGVLTIKVPITFAETVLTDDDTFEIDAPDFDDIDSSSIEIMEYDLTEDNSDYADPYYNICPDCGEKISVSNDGGNGFCSNCASKH